MLSPRHIWVVVLFAGMTKLCPAADPPLDIALQRGHKVTSAALSGDGRFVLTTGGNVVILWEAATGKRLRAFRGHKGPQEVSSAAISGDGKYVATGSGSDETAILWEAATGKKLHTFPGHSNRVAVALSPDGKLLATGSDKVEVSLWDTDSGKKVQTFTDNRGGKSNRVDRLAISGDGKTVLVVRDSSKTVECWDVATGARNMKMRGEHGLEINSVAVTPDGKRIVTGADDNTAAIWDAASGKQLKTFAGTPGAEPVKNRTFESKSIAGVAVSPDGKVVLTGTTDGTVLIRQAANAGRIQSFKEPTGALTGVGFSDDGKFVLTTTWKGPARLWDAASGKILQTFQGYNPPVASLALSKDGKTLVTGTNGQLAAVWDLPGGKLARTFQDFDARAVAVDDAGTRLATAGQAKVAVWDLTSGKRLQAYDSFYDNRYDKIFSIALSGDGRRAVVASAKDASVWSPPAAATKALQKEHLHVVTGVALSQDGTRAVTASLDGSAVVWNTATPKKLQTLMGTPVGGLVPPIHAVAMSADGTRVAAGQFGGTAVVWDATTGKPVQTFAGHTAEVKCVAMPADGKHLITGSGAAVILWHLENGKKKQTFDLGSLIREDLFKGKEDRQRALDEYGVGFVSGAALSPDGKHMWTATEDFTGVRLWDVASGKERARLICFDGGLDWLVVTPDGTFDGSPGAWRYVGFRAPGKTEVIDDEETRKSRHRPGLLTKLLTPAP